MKRINLFNPPHARADGRAEASWRQSVESAVQAKNAPELLSLFGQPHAKRQMHIGFSLKGVLGNSFASFCLNVPNGIWALRQVTTKVPGFTLEECCHHEFASGKLTVTSDMVLHEEALRLQGPSPDAMALALELEPNHESLAGPLPRFSGNSLHYEALTMLVGGVQVEHKESMAAICKMLLAHKAPVCTSRKPIEGYKAADVFFGSNWDKYEASELVADVLRHYVSNGEIDLESRTPCKGSRPVELAIMTGNGMAAALAIDLGCDLSADVARGTPDVLSLARSLAANDHTGRMLPLVTAAVMRRKLGESMSKDAHPQVAASIAQRRARTGL